MGAAPPSGLPTPPPEAALIRVAREARGLSLEDAARLTLIRLGGARWRQLERGYETKDKPVVAPARTLAHMAHVVGLGSDRLAAAGREDAAEILREIEAQEAGQQQLGALQPDLTDPQERAMWEMPGLPDETRRTMIEILRVGKAKAVRDDRRRRAG